MRGSQTEACLERILAALPGFELDRHVSSLKCVVAFGLRDGERICVKALHRSDPSWAWYFDREREVLGQLPGSLRAPRLRAVVDGLLVIDELPGTPLARYRRVEHPLSPAVVGSCLELADRVQTLELSLARAPEDAVVAQLRERLLEDPSAPQAWFHAGFERCARLGIVSSEQASLMHEALTAYPEVRTCHGDFLPRNLIVDGQRVSACDWECAGLHARDWDRALLWANSNAANRGQIEAAVAEPEERRRAFRALAAFALAREIKFAGRAPPARRAGLARELAELLGLLEAAP